MATKIRASTQLIADSATFVALACSGTASSANDVVNLATLEQKVIQGRTWREALLHADQLLDGASGGIKSAQAVWSTGNVSNNQTIVLKNGTVTETYTGKDAPAGGNDFQIGADGPASLAAFLAKVNANSDGTDGWSAVEATDLSSFGNGTYHVILICNNITDTTSRVYGSASSLRVAPFTATTYDYQLPAGLTNIPSSDPATRNFGFSRIQSDLKSGETHKILDGVDVDYAWDADSNAWTVSGLSVAAGNGIAVSGVTISAKRDVTGSANVATAISVGADGIGVRVDDATISYDAGTGRLEVKAGGIGNTHLGADCVDGDNIADDSIGAEHIIDGSVGEAALGAAAVSASKLHFFRDFAVGDGVETAFTLSNTPSDGALLLVFNGGIIQRGGGVDYTLATDTVTFATAPGDDDELQFFCVAI